MSATDRENWVRFVRRMHARYRERECEYWEAKIVRHAKDPKSLWATFNGRLGRTQSLQNSPPRTLRRTARARSAPSAPTLPAPQSGVSADRSSHGHTEGYLLRRAPLIHPSQPFRML